MGNSVTADEQHSRRKPTKHLASHVHLPLDAAASQGSFVVVLFLPTVVPSQLFGSYMQSWQLYTKNTSPLTAVTRSELKDPKSHLPTGTDRSHAVLPPPTRVHHSSHTKPFCKPASIPLHQSLRTAQADGLLLFPDSPITFLRTIRKLLH